MKTSRLIALALALALLTIAAGLRLSADAGPSASWRDAPDSNRYGPRTSVVWRSRAAVEDGTPSTYHRGLCPLKPSDAVPCARRSVEGDPCEVCAP